MNGDALTQNFGKLHALHVDALTRFLIECRRVFDGDLDLFLVLMIIGERTFSARHVPAAMSLERWRTATVRDLPVQAINLQSISEYSGIPRETVRRKLAILIEKRWVERDGSNYVTATDAARDGLYGLTETSIRYLRELDSALRAVSDDAEN